MHQPGPIPTRTEIMDCREADAQARRELWRIAREREEARRRAELADPPDVTGQPACTQIEGGQKARVDVFFSDDRQVIEQARAICAGCDHREPCLEGALTRREPCGVWGGERFRNGHVVVMRERRSSYRTAMTGAGGSGPA